MASKRKITNTNSQIISKAVEAVKGRPLIIGGVAAHPSDKIAYELVRYEEDGQTAVLSWGGVTKRFPASEVFDPNDAKEAALSFLFEAHKKRRAVV